MFSRNAQRKFYINPNGFACAHVRDVTFYKNITCPESPVNDRNAGGRIRAQTDGSAKRVYGHAIRDVIAASMSARCREFYNKA